MRTFRHLSWHWLIAAGLLACGIIFVDAMRGIAEDAPKAEDAASDSAEKSATEKDPVDDEAEDEEKSEMFKVPDGTPEELLKFIEETKAAKPTVRTNREVLQFIGKQQAAIVAAAGKILAAKPDTQIESKALGYKLDALMMLGQVGDQESAAAATKLAESLADDPRLSLAAKVHFVLIVGRLRELDQSDSGRRIKQIEGITADIQKQLDRGIVDPQFLQLAAFAARLAEQADPKLGLKTYQGFTAALSKSDDRAAKRTVAAMEGSLRFLSLLGKPMEIDGTLLNGDKFDWAAYRGKVVLVDFWATWCGPCIRELPNVKATYEKYHDRGFDVVGISLDDDKQALEEFVSDREIPWPTLFSIVADETGWQHPMATKYGITAIPTTILIGRDGNVVALEARGEKLPELVAEQLGDAKDPVDEKAPPSDAQESRDESDEESS